MPGRNFTSSSYRYGFNGKELDQEGMGGVGSTYDYGFRIYNPSLGKFLSADPLSPKYPWYTPYQFAGNNPVRFADIDGLEEYDTFKYGELEKDPTFVTAAVTANIGIKAFEAIGNCMLWAFEQTINNETEGFLIRRQFLKQGLDVSYRVTNVQLAEMFEFKKDYREIKIVFENSFWESAGNLGLGVLDLAGLLTPSKGGGAFLAPKAPLLLSPGNFLRSAKGLLYGFGSVHGTRIMHVLDHTVNNLSKNFHGVFKVDDLIGTIDEAWDIVKQVDPKKWSKTLSAGASETVDGVTRSLRKVGNEVYESFTVDLKKVIGYEGGKLGTGADLQKMTLSVKQGTSEVITAFPTK